MGIDNEIEKNYNQELNGFELKDVEECMYNEGSMQGYLFKYLHCGEHFLYVDCDWIKISIFLMEAKGHNCFIWFGWYFVCISTRISDRKWINVSMENDLQRKITFRNDRTF